MLFLFAPYDGFGDVVASVFDLFKDLRKKANDVELLDRHARAGALTGAANPKPTVNGVNLDRIF
jgi:hypothetical protein